MSRSPSFQSLRLKATLKKVPGLVRIVRLCRILGSPAYRSEWKLRRDRPDNLFQPFGFTSLDRYPRVLRHGELGASNAETCSHLIRFADFEETVAGLCRCLKPGGYLSIRHSNFRFSDTASASGFDTVFSFEGGTPRDDNPLYGPDDRRLANTVYNEIVFRKREIS